MLYVSISLGIFPGFRIRQTHIIHIRIEPCLVHKWNKLFNAELDLQVPDINVYALCKTQTLSSSISKKKEEKKSH